MRRQGHCRTSGRRRGCGRGQTPTCARAGQTDLGHRVRSAARSRAGREQPCRNCVVRLKLELNRINFLSDHRTAGWPPARASRRPVHHEPRRPTSAAGGNTTCTRVGIDWYANSVVAVLEAASPPSSRTPKAPAPPLGGRLAKSARSVARSPSGRPSPTSTAIRRSSATCRRRNVKIDDKDFNAQQIRPYAQKLSATPSLPVSGTDAVITVRRTSPTRNARRPRRPVDHGPEREPDRHEPTGRIARLARAVRPDHLASTGAQLRGHCSRSVKVRQVKATAVPTPRWDDGTPACRVDVKKLQCNNGVDLTGKDPAGLNEVRKKAKIELSSPARDRAPAYITHGGGRARGTRGDSRAVPEATRTARPHKSRSSRSSGRRFDVARSTTRAVGGQPDAGSRTWLCANRGKGDNKASTPPRSWHRCAPRPVCKGDVKDVLPST